jgi:hypothetical protein
MLDRIEIHNILSPIVAKLELLAQLPAVFDAARTKHGCHGVVLDMMADYISELRRTLDTFVDGYAQGL